MFKALFTLTAFEPGQLPGVFKSNHWVGDPVMTSYISKAPLVRKYSPKTTICYALGS